jgi:curli biogenesis system outer membrane secretion channel CsgG
MLRKTISLLLATVSVAVFNSAQADYVAYSINAKGEAKPLPESIDGINSKFLINVRWGDFGGGKIRVGVLPVENKSGVTEVSTKGNVGNVDVMIKRALSGQGVPVQGIEAMLTDSMFRTGRFTMVERQVLDSAIKEQDLGASGRVAKPSAAKIGNILGAQYLIKAVITEYNPNYSGRSIGLGAITGGALGGLGFNSKKSRIAMNFRLVDAATSEVIFTQQVEAVVGKTGFGFGAAGYGSSGAAGGAFSQYTAMPIGKAVSSAINQGVYALVKQIGAAPAQGSIIKAAGGKVYTNLRKGAVKSGDEVMVFSKGEALIDPDTGISLGAIEEEVGTIKILQATDKFSIAKAVSVDVKQLKSGDIVRSLVPAEPLQFAEIWEEPKSEDVDDGGSEEGGS